MLFRRRGFKVKLRGRSGVEYAERDRKVLLGSEFLAGDGGIIIYSNTMAAWRTPTGVIPMTEDDKSRVRANVSEDLERHRIPVEWA